MSMWTKIPKLRGIRKSLAQKEEIIDEKIVDEFISSPGQNKLENYIVKAIKLGQIQICKGVGAFFYVHVVGSAQNVHESPQ